MRRNVRIVNPHPFHKRPPPPEWERAMPILLLVVGGGFMFVAGPRSVDDPTSAGFMLWAIGLFLAGFGMWWIFTRAPERYPPDR